MADQKDSKPQPPMVPEVKRALMAILIENGMDPGLVDIIAKMQPYKIQLFDRLYQGYGRRPDYIRGRARELLKIDLMKPHIRKIIEADENKALWDEDRFIEFAFVYYRKALVLEFLKTEMHEYMNTLGSSQDRTSFILTTQPEKVRIV